MDRLTDNLVVLGESAAYFAALIVLIVVARLVKRVTGGYLLDEQLTKHDNPAVAISFAGYLAGLFFALSGAFLGPGSGDLLLDLAEVGIWGAFAIAALNLGRILVDHLVLRQFGTAEELVVDQNIGVAVAEASGYVTVGFIVGIAVSGEGLWWLALIDLAVGLLAFVAGAALLRITLFRSYDLQKEIHDDNHAAGIVFGLHLLAFGWIIQSALYASDVTSWLNDDSTVTDVAVGVGWELLNSAIFLVVGAITLVLLALVTDKLMLPAARLRDEILEDRNVGAALISGVVAVCGAMAITTIF